MRVGLLFVALMLLTSVAMAQTHDHAAPVVKHVDGREHPEQIPDEVAYFNYFMGRSVSADVALPAEEQRHIENGIRMLQLETKDELQFRLAMTEFRSKFEHFNAVYTAKAEKGRATVFDFWYGPGGIAQIVAETRARLTKGLSKNGQGSFELEVLRMRHNTTCDGCGGAK